MNAAQMAAHCAVFMEAALADIRPKRMFLGRLFGPVVKYFALRDEKPMGRNLPTVPGFEVETIASSSKSVSVSPRSSTASSAADRQRLLPIRTASSGE